MFDFAMTEDILENVMLLNMNNSTVKDSKYTTILT